MKKAIKTLGKAVLDVTVILLVILLSLYIYHKALLSDDSRQLNGQYGEITTVCMEER